LELSDYCVVYLAEVLERVDDFLIHINRIEPLEIETLIGKYWGDIWNYAFVLTNAFVMTSAKSASAESVFFENVMVDAVWKHLLALPNKYREVLLLEIRYSFSYAEMADFLGITEGTVKSRLHRARNAMRKKMEEENS
jgi:RNA polymerase sigma-70 factor (ECF subfamily)